MMGAFNWLGDRLLAAAHAARSNTLEGSRKNIEEHYDAGQLHFVVLGNMLAAHARKQQRRRRRRRRRAALGGSAIILASP